MKPAQFRDMLKVFLGGGGGLKESVCQIFFSNTVLDRKWGISILDHYQDFFSSFY